MRFNKFSALFALLLNIASLAGAQAVYVPPPKLAASITIAASDSSAAAKAGADYVCTGTSDQTLINSAITGLPAKGGKITFLAGTYNISGSIIIDRSYVDLEGETHPHWGGYVNAWIGTTNPTGLEGTNSAKIKASATGFNLIQLNTTLNLPDGGEGRHRGIRIAKLYLYGNGYSSTGIAGGGYSDVYVFEDDFIQHVNVGIDVTIDTPTLRALDVQDCSGDAIRVGGYLGQVYGCLAYDCGGNGITVSGDSSVVTGCNIGDCYYGIYLNYTNGAVISGNTIRGTTVKAIAADGGFGHSITGNTISNKNGGNQTDTGQYPSRSIEGITIGAVAACTGVTVSNNTFNSFLQSGTNGTTGFSASNIVTSGYAIAFRNGSTGAATGNAISSAWHSGGATTIYWLTGTAVVGNNFGDNATSSTTLGPATISSATWQAWYKADAITGNTNGTALSGTWPDSSGAGYPLSVAGSAPLYETNVINGKQTLRFDGSTTAMTSTTFPVLAQPFTYFVVAKQAAADSTNSRVLVASRVSATNATIFEQNNQTLNAYANTFTSSTLAASPGAFHIFEVYFNSAGGAATSVMRVDGGTPVTLNLGPSNLGGGLYIGADAVAASNEIWNGDIAEVAIATGTITTADRNTVVHALETKYGLTIAP